MNLKKLLTTYCCAFLQFEKFNFFNHVLIFVLHNFFHFHEKLRNDEQQEDGQRTKEMINNKRAKKIYQKKITTITTIAIAPTNIVIVALTQIVPTKQKLTKVNNEQQEGEQRDDEQQEDQEDNEEHDGCELNTQLT